MIHLLRSGRVALIVMILVQLGLTAAAQASLSDFEQALRAIPVSDVARCVTAVELGRSQPDFPSSEVLQFLDRLATSSYTSPDREAILLDLVVAMEEGLPVDGLVTKGLEGLARGVPAANLQQSLHQRLVLLAETRDLLYAKGIFSVAPGSPQSVDTALPTPRFNLLVTHVSDTIADYLEGGGSPFEGHTLLQEVRFRLTSLERATLNPEDVELVLKRIEPADLTRVALSAVS